MARMRTIKQTVEHFKSQDPDTAVNEWWLRGLVKTGKIKCHKAGSKYLIDIDAFEEFLKNPPQEPEEVSAYGKLRKIN